MSKQENSPDRMDHFETSLTELEALVEELERGEISLEDSLKQFERGVQLARNCQQALKDAELKVQQLLGNNAQAELQPLDDMDSPAGDPAE